MRCKFCDGKKRIPISGGSYRCPYCEVAIKVPEIEMHRMAHQACKDAGFENPEELVSAHKTLENDFNHLVRLIKGFETFQEDPANAGWNKLPQRLKDYIDNFEMLDLSAAVETDLSDRNLNDKSFCSYPDCACSIDRPSGGKCWQGLPDKTQTSALKASRGEE